MYRLAMQIGEQQHDLGILTPKNNLFEINTKIVRKKVGTGVPTFCLKPAHKQYSSLAVDISPVEPFAYLWRLHEAYLIREKGIISVRFKEKK